MVDIEQVTQHCLAKPGAWADDPWGTEHPVVKVGPEGRGKIFAFLGRGGVGVKAGAGRDEADAWLERYPDDVTVMAYIGRSGWNDLLLSGAIPDEELLDAIDDSYRRVVAALPAAHRPEGWDAEPEPEPEPEPAPEPAPESAPGSDDPELELGLERD